MQVSEQFFALLTSSPSLIAMSPLQLIKQTSSLTEQMCVNGLKKIVHVVVKNAPFSVYVTVNPVFTQLFHQMHPSHRFDLSNFVIEAVLLYDSDSEEREVDFVKHKPLDFKCNITSSGEQATVDLKANVLSSQHSGSFFRIKIQLLTTGRRHLGAALSCEPLRVISKIDNMKPPKKQAKKRTFTDTVEETLGRIESHQQQNITLLGSLLQEAAASASASLSSSSSSLSSSTDDPANNATTTTTTDASSALHRLLPSAAALSSLLGPSTGDNKKTDFEGSFRNFLRIFSQLPSEERPLKIRHLIKNSNQRDAEKYAELLDMFLVEGLQRSDQHSGSGGSGTFSAATLTPTLCKCQTCPFQQELERIDQFYKDFIVAPFETTTTEQDDPFFSTTN